MAVYYWIRAERNGSVYYLNRNRKGRFSNISDRRSKIKMFKTEAEADKAKSIIEFCHSGYWDKIEVKSV